MVKPLFSPLAPDELGDDSIRPGERSLHFFRRQSLPEFVEYREWIEELFQGLPGGQHEKFRPRLRNKRFLQFQSALFEMQLYRMLKRLGLAVEIEGELPGTGKKVDFGVQDGDQSCFLEATVCGVGQGIFSDTDQEYDVIRKLQQRLPDPHLDIRLEAEGHLQRTLRKAEIAEIAGRIKKHLEFFPREWFAQRGIRVQKVNRWTVRTAGIRATEEECIAEYRDSDNWTLKWTLALPLPGRRGHVRLPSRSGAPDRFGPLLEAIKEKARDWRGIDLGHPLVLAVNNCHSEFKWDPYGIRCALANDDDATHHASFPHAFHRISGVVVVGNACMGAELGARVKLFRNGNKEIPRFLHSLEEERAFGELLGLSGPWGRTGPGAGP